MNFTNAEIEFLCLALMLQERPVCEAFSINVSSAILTPNLTAILYKLKLNQG